MSTLKVILNSIFVPLTLFVAWFMIMGLKQLKKDRETGGPDGLGAIGTALALPILIINFFVLMVLILLLMSVNK